MKAAIQVGVGRYDVRDVPTPDITPTQCLIRVGACTICGTDVKYFKGVTQLDWPSPMGHEVTGTVEAVGCDVVGFAPGDRVLSRMAWGGFAQYVPAEADLLAHLPDGIEFEHGAIGQMLPLAVRGAELAVRPGATVFVSGLGGAGLMCVQAARAYGAARVLAADPYALRRGLAVELGADLAIDPSAEDVVARVRAEIDGGIDVAMEAAGVEPSFRTCERVVRVGGVVSIYGTHVEPIALDMVHWERNCLQLHMMAEPAGEKGPMLQKAVALMADGRVRLAPILSDVMPLADIMDAFRRVIDEPDKVVKIAVVPPG